MTSTVFPALLLALGLMGPATQSADSTPQPKVPAMQTQPDALQTQLDAVQAQADAMRTLGLTRLGAYEELERLLAVAPHRLVGSAGAEAAVKYGLQRMAEVGLQQVHLEPTQVPSWTRGEPESLSVTSPETHRDLPLRLAAIGGSIATPKEGVEAPVVRVRAFDDLAARKDELAGKIVFLDPPVPWGSLEAFGIYGALGKSRVRGASEAAKYGAVALLTRAITTRRDDVPHTGMMIYSPDQPKIPAASLAYLSAERLAGLLEAGVPVTVRLRLHCSQGPDVTSHNVIGEVTGSEFPNDVIVLGCHLDSWDLSHGAHDDGAGCAQALEALRLIKESGFKPKRTIRAIWYMNEEFGGTGGEDYARHPQRKTERHLLAVESDRGGFTPRGFSMNAPPEEVERWNQYQPLFKSVGIDWFQKGGSGVDVHHLEDIGALCMGYVPDSQRYMDLHHSANDVLAEVNPRELELGAIAMATLALVASELHVFSPAEKQPPQ